MTHLTKPQTHYYNAHGRRRKARRGPDRRVSQWLLIFRERRKKDTERRCGFDRRQQAAPAKPPHGGYH